MPSVEPLRNGQAIAAASAPTVPQQDGASQCGHDATENQQDKHALNPILFAAYFLMGTTAAADAVPWGTTGMPACARLESTGFPRTCLRTTTYPRQ